MGALISGIRNMTGLTRFKNFSSGILILYINSLNESLLYIYLINLNTTFIDILIIVKIYFLIK